MVFAGSNRGPAWSAACALLLVVVPLVSGSVVDPVLENDAGSGRDAGETSDGAVPIATDTEYEATFVGQGSDLRGPISDVDWYSFPAVAGAEFVARMATPGFAWMRVYDPHGVEVNQTTGTAFNYAFNVVEAGGITFPVNETGTWFVAFGALSWAGPYSFSLDTLVPANAVQPPIPEGCHTEYVLVPGTLTLVPHFTDDCLHMRTNVNRLDTAIIDVLIVPPVGPWAERDLRMTRQAIEMWDEGIHQLAAEMGLDWLDESVQFNVLVAGDNITTDPLWDPEIIVVAANPVLAGVQGLGTQPLPPLGPCRGANPMASAVDWLGLPGFDSHHGGQSGTYVEECEGGGTTCYAVNLALDFVPGVYEDFLGVNTFDLVAHEVGHCLTIGHVGDAGDHKADVVPHGDIMAYTDQPHYKCVSTLDVEAFAVTMSGLLLEAPILPNHRVDDVRGPFQIQHPDDHWYASPSGAPEDCPQPDAWLVPGEEPPEEIQENDAGSGGDAPGDVGVKLTVQPDTVYAGRSFGPFIDNYDIYHFTGEAGQEVQIRFDGNWGSYSLLNATGEPFDGSASSLGYTPINTGPLVRELPYTGDFYFRVAHLAPAYYQFAYSFDGPPPSVNLLDQL